MAPNLTVVIPVWDQHVAFLPRCLHSIAAEQVPAHLIIVDNASQVPVAVPPGARVVRVQERRTIGAARNAGLAEVGTPFVVFADADDEIAAGSLAHGLDLLHRDDRAVGVLGRSIVDEYGERQRRGRTPSKSFLTTSHLAPRIARLFWLAAFQASITSTVLRTSCVRDAGAFADDDLGEDWRLAARMARRGPFICIDQPVRIYHRHHAAIRNASHRHVSPSEQRHAVCDDCITDPAATRVARLVASAIRRWG